MMMAIKSLIAAIACLGLWVGLMQSSAIAVPPPTQPNSPAQAALQRLLTTTPIQADWFTPDFLAQVPVAQVQSILVSLQTELGAFQRVEAKGNDQQLVFENGIVPTKIAVNAKGQIAGLLFQPPLRQFKTLDEAVSNFKTIPGKVSLLVREDGVDRAALNATQPLAVGSAFKLAVLEAIQAQVKSGQHTWKEAVALKAEWRSLPSGILQSWPDGALLTIESLAALMISQSDNTATDRLIYLVGREAIEALSPHSRPFLTTREAFVLKGKQNADLLQRYRRDSESARRSLLPETLKRPLPDVFEFTGDAIAQDVEWFFSTSELCDRMERVKDLPLMSINPGAANPQDWARVAFKGGSEPGVINLTTWLQAKNGKRYCVSATWNQPEAIDQERFTALYRGTLELLK
jgi:beta-lactamase class A